MSWHLVVAISSVILVVWQLLRFWLAAAAAAVVVVVGALLQCLPEGHRDGQPSVSHLGRSAPPPQIPLGVKLELGRCWQTAGEPTLRAWAVVEAVVEAEAWAVAEVEAEVEAEVRGREVLE